MVTQVDQGEQVVLRSRPRLAGEHQLREHRCHIAAAPYLYDVQTRTQQHVSGGAGGSVLERNATSFDLRVGGSVHQLVGQ